MMVAFGMSIPPFVIIPCVEYYYRLSRGKTELKSLCLWKPFVLLRIVKSSL